MAFISIYVNKADIISMTIAKSMDQQSEGVEEEPDLVELIFFAYRDFTGDPDEILDQLGFGRAHHRVLHFVGARPGLTVAELLDVLRITKQSLARVLKQLVEDGYIRQEAGPADRRQRHLHLTGSGNELIARLREPQSRRIENALIRSGVDRQKAASFLAAMQDEDATD